MFISPNFSHFLLWFSSIYLILSFHLNTLGFTKRFICWIDLFFFNISLFFELYIMIIWSLWATYSVKYCWLNTVLHSFYNIFPSEWKFFETFLLIFSRPNSKTLETCRKWYMIVACTCSYCWKKYIFIPQMLMFFIINKGSTFR